MSFSRKKRSEAPSTLAPANGLASSQVTQQLQFPTNSQSPQEKQPSRALCLWSAHAPPFEQLPSPLFRENHALSTSATAVGEFFLFGGYVHGSKSPSNDLYMFSTRDFSTTLLQTSGDVPSPRYGHCAVLTSTILLIWGGTSNLRDRNEALDDSLYLLNLVSREWTRIMVNGPGPGGRRYHTMTLVGSKLFVFGGKSPTGYFNDIWALDLNCLTSNPFWESYEPATGNEKPPPRTGHVSVTTGDRIIIFGGGGSRGGPHVFNDTWSFNISTRKWTELQCTGSIPSPRASHAAVLIGDVMYVYGGCTAGRTCLGDLTAFNLSTQRWTAFQDIGSSPGRRRAHAMAFDGRHLFLLGGKLSPGAQVEEAKPIHVLNTKLLVYPNPDSNTVEHSEKTTQLALKLSTGHPTQGQPQQPTFSSSDSDFHAEHGASPFKKAGESDHPVSPQIIRDRTFRPNDLPSLLPGMNDSSRSIPEEDTDSEGSTEHHAKLVVPDASSEKEVALLHNKRIADRERQLSETLDERDRHIAQLTDQLALKSTLLEQAAEEKKRAGLELHKLQAKLDESLLSRDHALEQAQSALQKASCAAKANEQSQREITEMRAELETRKSESAASRLRLTDTETNYARSKAQADTYRTKTEKGLDSMDEDRVVHKLMERVRAMEAEMASRQWNEKSFEMMECRNEG